jgi:hypothetical protein
MSGAEYLWRKKRGGRLQTLVPVRFVDYDTCPAFVIVRTLAGERWRCPREDVLVRIIRDYP